MNEEILELHGVLTVEDGRLVLTSVATMFTSEEIARLRTGGEVSIDPEAPGRHVLAHDAAKDLASALQHFVGREVVLLARDSGPGLTRCESDANVLALRPDDPYVIWATDELPFACPKGLVVHERRAWAVAYGSEPHKLAQLDSECPCGRSPHWTSSLVFKVEPAIVDEIVRGFVIEGREFHLSDIPAHGCKHLGYYMVDCSHGRACHHCRDGLCTDEEAVLARKRGAAFERQMRSKKEG